MYILDRMSFPTSKSSLRVPLRLMSIAGYKRLVGQLAIQDDFAVASSLEFFKNNFIHLAAGINQGCRNNCQTAALFYITRRTKESFWTLQGIGIHTPGQNLAAGRHNRIIGATQTSNRIQQNNDIFPASTNLFAFSITISATWMWRAAGSSNVLEITSPLTLRFISVTSSGRSSISRTISVTSG